MARTSSSPLSGYLPWICVGLLLLVGFFYFNSQSKTPSSPHPIDAVCVLVPAKNSGVNGVTTLSAAESELVGTERVDGEADGIQLRRRTDRKEGLDDS